EKDKNHKNGKPRIFHRIHQAETNCHWPETRWSCYSNDNRIIIWMGSSLSSLSPGAAKRLVNHGPCIELIEFDFNEFHSGLQRFALREQNFQIVGARRPE